MWRQKINFHKAVIGCKKNVSHGHRHAAAYILEISTIVCTKSVDSDI